MLKFQREIASDALFEEMTPFFEAHYKEIAHFQDIPLDPDFPQYLLVEAAGLLRIYTARDENNLLLGYAWYFVRPNFHYRTSKQAYQDILFVSPEKRGFGEKFIVWCDVQLKAEGVQVVCHHVKEKHNFGPLLERLGYELTDLLWQKRLDKEEA